jgi:hypothetical protein
MVDSTLEGNVASMTLDLKSINGSLNQLTRALASIDSSLKQIGGALATLDNSLIATHLQNIAKGVGAKK